MQAFYNVADSGGFEPPTARFVAEYSIQLSYESTLVFIQITTGFALKESINRPSKMADSGGFEPPTARFVAEYSIQLSYESANGGEGGIRTPDTLLRCTPLAGERLRPLGHLSATRGA